MLSYYNGRELPAEYIAANMVYMADLHIDYLANGNTTTGLLGALY